MSRFSHLRDAFHGRQLRVHGETRGEHAVARDQRNHRQLRDRCDRSGDQDHQLSRSRHVRAGQIAIFCRDRRGRGRVRGQLRRGCRFSIFCMPPVPLDPVSQPSVAGDSNS